MISNFKFQISNSRGFTIIELLVSTVIFLLVLGVTVNIFIAVVKNQRQILKEEQELNQISYAVEYMSKALRMVKKQVTDDVPCLEDGYFYQLTRPEAGFYTGIKFINASAGNLCQEFLLDNGVLKDLKNSSNLDDAVPLTPEGLEIKTIKFGVNGSDGCYGAGCPDGAFYDENDSYQIQPRVTILMDIGGKIIQTTVSARNLNIQ